MQSFQQTINHLNESKLLVKNAVDQWSEKIIVSQEGGILKLDISQLQQLKNPKAYLYELLHPYGFTEWEDVISLLHVR